MTSVAVDSLSAFLTQIDQHIAADNLEKVHPPKNMMDLGELQSHFETLNKHLNNYRELKEVSIHFQRLQTLQRQITNFQGLLTIVKRTEKLAIHDLLLAKEKLNNDKVLFEKSIISKVDLMAQ